MSECGEIAESIWNGEKDKSPFLSFDDALAYVREKMPDQGEVILSNVAEHVLKLSRKRS